MDITHDTCKVALFGHRRFDGYRAVDVHLLEILKDIMNENKFVDIYIGRNGEFDIYAASVIKRAQRLFGNDNSELICILPYNERNIEYYEGYYDSVKIFEEPQCHPKAAITKRNRFMVEMCDIIICYVNRNEGGAYRAMKYAQKLNKRIINIVDYK